MKYRSILGGIALIGLVAVTGCSRGALHENNEGNHNGERFVRSITRNADGGHGNRSTRGFTRGLNSTTRRDNNRHHNANRHHMTDRNTTGLGTTNRDYTANRDYAANRDYNTNRDYLNSRTHRNTSPDFAINYTDDSRLTVPVMAMDNVEANAVAEFFGARRNRNRAPEAAPAPAVPEPSPAQPEGANDEIDTQHDLTEDEEAITLPAPAPTTPAPAPAPTPGSTVERLMK
jgi:hypothetical protein